MADGYITYSTRLDNKRLEKELSKATKKVEQLEGQVQKNEGKRLPLVEQTSELGAKLDEAKAKMAALQDESRRVSAALSDANANDPASIAAYQEAVSRKPSIDKELAASQKVVDSLQSKFDAADRKLKAVEDTAKRLDDELNEAKEKAGGIADELSRPATAGEKMGDAIAYADKQMTKFTKRVAGLAKRVFVFALITKALRAIRDMMSGYVTENNEASKAIAQLKGALLTLAQPLISVIIPAFTALVNILTRVVAAAASLVSLLFGKTIKQSKDAAKAMYNEADAIKSAGSAADKAAGSLAAFDEINQLSDSSGGASSATTPDFSFDTSTVQADMEKLLGWVKLIGAGLLAWKLSDNLLGGLKTFGGLIIAINGAIELAKGTWDAWQNGLTMDNLTEMLKGTLLLATGLYIAFGTVGAGIGLLVAGFVLLVTSLHDVMENGWNLQNLLGSIAGILVAGIGIGLLTGSWLPLLIAGIASVLLALTVATGHGEELIGGIRQVCQGFVDFIVGIFTGDIDRALAGVSGIFDGLGVAIGAVIDGVRDTFLSFLDWLDEKTGGKFHGIIEVAKGFITGFFGDVKALFSENVENLKLIFSGITKFLSGVFTNDWDMAWEGVKDIFKGVINGILSLFESMVNFIGSGLNVVIRGIKKFTAFSLPDWMGGYKFEGISIPEISKVRLPRLATGAVIPPNREFLAVLGDQTSGTNIEAPLSTIKQAVAEVLREYGGGTPSEIRVELLLDGKKLAVNQVKHINAMTEQAGRPVLKF